MFEPVLVTLTVFALPPAPEVPPKVKFMAGLSDMALTAQHATGERKGEILFLAVVEVMAASAAHTSIE